MRARGFSWPSHFTQSTCCNTKHSGTELINICWVKKSEHYIWGGMYPKGHKGFRATAINEHGLSCIPTGSPSMDAPSRKPRINTLNLCWTLHIFYLPLCLKWYNPAVTYIIQEGVCHLNGNAIPFYISKLSICELWDMCVASKGEKVFGNNCLKIFKEDCSCLHS